jgi:hypothetical protein
MWTPAPRPAHVLHDAQAPGHATTGLATVLFLFLNSPSRCLHQLGVGRAWATFGRVAGDVHEDALLLAARALRGRRGRGLIGVAAFRTFPPGLGGEFACWHGFLLTMDGGRWTTDDDVPVLLFWLAWLDDESDAINNFTDAR